MKMKLLKTRNKIIDIYLYIKRSRPLIFQTMNPLQSNNPCLKYYRFTPSSCKDIGIRKFELVAKTEFFYF